MSKERERRAKKILFVSPDLGPGGAQRQLVNIANGFYERGYKVSVFLFRRKGDLKNSLHRNIEILSPPTPGLIKRFTLFRVAYGTIIFFMTVARKRPDIIYSRQWPKMLIPFTGRFFGVKTVSVEGNNLEHGLKKRPLLLWIRKFCARLSDEVVANSKSLAREVKETFGLPSDVAVIYNGIDARHIREKAAEETTHEWLETDVPTILAVGTHRKLRQKGFAHLLEAMSIVNLSRKARLIIIGSGNKEEMAKLSEKLSIDDRTELLDAMPNPFPYIARADVFVCSSLYEGLSNVILEAMALERPVVSTNHRHGANEIIENGKNGILVPVEDPESMADAILKVLKNENLRRELGVEALKRSEYFSRDRMISKYEKLFCNINVEPRDT